MMFQKAVKVRNKRSSGNPLMVCCSFVGNVKRQRENKIIQKEREKERE